MPGSISVFCRPFSLSQRLPTGIWGSWSLLEGETPARCVSDPPSVTAEVHEYKFSDLSTMVVRLPHLSTFQFLSHRECKTLWKRSWLEGAGTSREP